MGPRMRPTEAPELMEVLTCPASVPAAPTVTVKTSGHHSHAPLAANSAAPYAASMFCALLVGTPSNSSSHNYVESYLWKSSRHIQA